MRPEDLPQSAWDDIWPEVNAHLGTSAGSLVELVRELGDRRFGHVPRVGDAFCGGGSIPFEAARLGCDVYASDLNPIACLLTWGALHIVGGDPETRARIAAAQAGIAAAVDRQIVALGIEHDGGPDDLRLPADAPTRWSHGWRVGRGGAAVAPETPPYEATCPVTGWQVPLIDTRQVHRASGTVLALIPFPEERRYRLETRSGVSEDDWQAAARGSVVREDGDLWLVHDPGQGPARVRMGNRAKAYLYCLETRCPKTGWQVPMAPSWVISHNYRTVAQLGPDPEARRIAIRVVSDASDADLEVARSGGTVADRALRYRLDGREHVTPLSAIRGDVELRSRYTDDAERRRDEDRLAAVRNRYSETAGNELRRWEKTDFVPRPDDVFQERLYAIQWIRPNGELFFAAPTPADLERERRVEAEVAAYLAEWQAAGLVPDSPIEPGAETTRLFRERGWIHWHHLFGPRHLLVGAMIRRETLRLEDRILSSAAALAVCRVLTWMSRLTRWNVGFPGRPGVAPSADTVKDVFYNQALNTFFNFGCRSFQSGREGLLLNSDAFPLAVTADIRCAPAADVATECDIFVTDPPYADAIQYHEITEYFLAWLRRSPPRPDWIWDSRRELAIRGEARAFRPAMVAAYSAMARQMPENGLQVVMFTHQDVGVWADLAEVLWAAGLQATAGWCVATETTSGTKEGNYVQGTVLLVLRRRRGEEKGFLPRLQNRWRRR